MVVIRISFETKGNFIIHTNFSNHKMSYYNKTYYFSFNFNLKHFAILT